MPIEFRCSQCQKLLRVSNDAAGCAADCPGCGAPLTVPGGEAPKVDTLYDGGANDPLFAPLPAPPPPRAEDDNPYRAPAPRSYAKPGVPAQRSGRRDGPAWEREGMRPFPLFMTIFDLHRSPIRFFSTMRRDEGIGSPLIFYFVVTMVPAFVVIFTGPMAATLRAARGQSIFLQHPILLVPLILLSGTIGMAIGAAIIQFGLSMVGAAKESYETTFRVLCYSYGANVWQLIPVVGPVISSLATLVFCVIGLAYAHNTQIWRVILGLIAPFLVCGGLCFGGFVLLGLVAQDMRPVNQQPVQPRLQWSPPREEALDEEMGNPSLAVSRHDVPSRIAKIRTNNF